MTSNDSPSAETKSKTGIKVIIVGAGFGGLTTAIECYLQFSLAINRPYFIAELTFVAEITFLHLEVSRRT
jgi:hypothetical protein